MRRLKTFIRISDQTRGYLSSIFETWLQLFIFWDLNRSGGYKFFLVLVKSSIWPFFEVMLLYFARCGKNRIVIITLNWHEILKKCRQNFFCPNVESKKWRWTCNFCSFVITRWRFNGDGINIGKTKITKYKPITVSCTNIGKRMRVILLGFFVSLVINLNAFAQSNDWLQNTETRFKLFFSSSWGWRLIFNVPTNLWQWKLKLVEWAGLILTIELA